MGNSGIPAFSEVDGPHAKVHELGKLAIIAYNSGEKDKATKYCREMVEISSHLI
jgi:methyl-accepting chemotaxis protein